MLDPAYLAIREAIRQILGFAEFLSCVTFRLHYGAGQQRLILETGSGEVFEAAHGLYLRYRFEYCPPFGNYVEGPFSPFMTVAL